MFERGSTVSGVPWRMVHFRSPFEIVMLLSNESEGVQSAINLLLFVHVCVAMPWCCLK